MAIQPCLLSYDADAESYGVALIDTVSGLPLQISRNALKDLDDAEAFLAWFLRTTRGDDLRKVVADELERIAESWNAGERDSWRCDVEASEEARQAGFAASDRADDEAADMEDERNADCEHAHALAEEWS